MPKVKVAGFSLTLDGFSAGINQSRADPLGLGGPKMFDWMFPTRYFHEMTGKPGGETGVDNDFALRAMSGFGAFILGRNMFGPIRGPWPSEDWKGWWGPNPPYHAPTFILTHHARKPIVMEGGTTFHFVTEGLESALAQARQAAGGKDVKIGGGVSTVRQYLALNAIDEIHLALSPALLGKGEALFGGNPAIDLVARGFKVTEQVATPRAMHVVLARE